MRESDGEILQDISFLLSGVVQSISFTAARFYRICFLGSHDKVTQSILQSTESAMPMDSKQVLRISLIELKRDLKIRTLNPN